MKLHGYLRGSGRLGNIVCARVGRETIAKTHNPNKANPNTEAQINERSRFKLITQIAASFAPVIAIPKEGNQSKRNRFVRRNYDILHAEEGQAFIDITQIQLTQGVFYIPGVSGYLSPTDGKLNVVLDTEVQARVSRIVYIVFQILDKGKMVLKTSKVVEDSGQTRDYATEISFDGTKGIVYAYGIKDKNVQATTKYRAWEVISAERIAQLVVRRAIEPTYFQFSKTTAKTFGTKEQDIEIVNVRFVINGQATTFEKERFEDGVLDVGTNRLTQLYINVNKRTDNIVIGFLLENRTIIYRKTIWKSNQYGYGADPWVSAYYKQAYIYIDGVRKLLISAI